MNRITCIILCLLSLAVFSQENTEEYKDSIANFYLQKLQTAYNEGDYSLHKKYSDSLYSWGKANTQFKYQVLGMVNQAVFHNNNAEQDKSIELYREALVILDSIPEDYRTKIIVTTNLGNAYARINAHEKSISAMEQVLLLLDTFEDNPKIRASALNGLANNYQKLNDYDNSLKYYRETKALGEEINNEKIVATALNNISDTYQLKGEYQKSKEVCAAALKIEYLKKETKERAWLLTSLGFAEWKLGNIKTAISKMEEAKDIAIAKGLPQLEMEAYEHLGELYGLTGENKKAITAKNRHLTLKNNFLQKKQEATKIDLEKDISSQKELLQKRALDINELTKNKKALLAWSLALVLVLFLTAAGFFWYRKHSKNQQELLIAQFEDFKENLTNTKSFEGEVPLTNIEVKATAYRNSSLKKEDYHRLKEKLSALMELEKPHLNPDLTHALLADKMEISGHHLSEILNVGYDQNFYNFINSYRVLEAQKLLTDGSNKETKLIAIAFDSGFKSKTSFNRIFKKHTGKTPSAFKNSIS